MKVLTVRQPWAWLIVQGYKDIENRTWSTAHRGPLLIHAAAAKPDPEDLDWLRKAAREDGVPFPDLVTGAILGGVTLTDCVTEHPSDWFDGPVGWVLTDSFVFVEPIPAKGRLGLWDADVEFELAEEAL